MTTRALIAGSIFVSSGMSRLLAAGYSAKSASEDLRQPGGTAAGQERRRAGDSPNLPLQNPDADLVVFDLRGDAGHGVADLGELVPDVAAGDRERQALHGGRWCYGVHALASRYGP